ncbi:[FeFe] hydrogenase H-cluster radical SAM maturase HydE [Porphyromonas levii]|uniref:[FeFe] hydrogenase H-cluster radical SAM maturase HydE n=1 Tax=Porphyromonas levii TaxID=28114 RepID=UPI001B8D5D14|nr:[FeFe] hydrogenase H-cluster radical SAM maturase HydE [Porphyromonas levii]MBR8702552.1 [FeFe] hydrogenase maturase subunit HydE [Porphyromonas levii]MBR8713518.1 [FeFe] hydrogenase maturase subunit HydE [Porphyromonas levii]MBR8715559.1 [FeFe] hydrogenase maturase subunit HydE [Porphyromonas levii]MBR8728077.1 [FeFe] hydrogenase maturase subunit HydE [Porphyromonas levii]MBR8731808.1 [FeFe] hydrogenase maturase subunit HydE [Porphyromonas levii]
MQILINKLKDGERLSEVDFLSLLSLPTTEIEEIAGQVARNRLGYTVFLRGLIEISNYCRCNCYYCGIRSGNKEVVRYRLSHDEILETCQIGAKLGFQTFVLQGGEDPYWRGERLVQLITQIHKSYPDITITLSLGEMMMDEYQALYEAGARRYLLRHETIDPIHFQQLHPVDQTIATRLEALRALKAIGFETGVGGMVGSPGQTLHHLTKDLCFIQQFQPDMIGIGPFIPHNDTPFRHYPSGSLDLTLRMVALCRLICPNANIPATTAVASLASDGRRKTLDAGANVVMPNLSPPTYRDYYSLYNNKARTGSEAAEGLTLLRAELSQYGYTTL